MAYMGFFAPLPAADLRNIIARYTATYTNVADTDYVGGRAIESNAGGQFNAIPLSGYQMAATGDEINVIGQISLETSWAPGQNTSLMQGGGSRATGNTSPLFGIQATDDDKLQVYLDVSGTRRSSASTASALTIGTPIIYRVRFKRLGATSQEAELYYWESGAWVSKASVSASDTWSASNTVKCIRLGIIESFAKGGSGTVHYGLHIVGTGATVPSATALFAAALPDGEGATDEWTPSTGTDSSAVIDDAFGSESTADYTESTSTTLEKKQELTAAAIGISGGTVLGLNFILGVTTPTSAPAAATYTVNPKLSGSEDAQDAYFGDTGYGAGATANGGYIQRFFETKPGGGAWTESDIDTATYQIEKEATAGGVNFRVHSMAIQVLYEAAAAGGGRTQGYIF